MRETKDPLISVVVTTYNRKELLKETITSILEQTYKNFELVVVDNYSNYDFINHIKTFNDSRIRSFQNKNNGIIAINRNFGIKKAKGDYLAFCDDDDLWYKNKLEIQINVLTNDTSLIGVGSNVSLIGATKIVRNKGVEKDCRIDFSSAYLFNTCPLSSLMVRNTGLLFDKNPKLRAVEDFDFQLNLLMTKKNILLLKQALVYYRVHLENISSNTGDLLNALNVLNKFKTNVDGVLYKKAKALVYSTAGLKLLKRSKDKLSRSYLKTAFDLSESFNLKLKIIILIFGSFFPPFLRWVLKAYYRLF